MDNVKIVEEMIIKSLTELMGLTCEDNTKDARSNLIFPKYRNNGGKRVSEQEAKLLFVKQIENNGTFLYSVETPTEDSYSFSGENPRSGCIDMCLHEKNGSRIHLIEFKAKTPKQSSYSKDFEKLLCDTKNLTNYFIHILEDTDNGTIPSVEDKYREAYNNTVNKSEKKIQSNLKIFLCDIGRTKEIRAYEFDDKGELNKIK